MSANEIQFDDSDEIQDGQYEGEEYTSSYATKDIKINTQTIALSSLIHRLKHEEIDLQHKDAIEVLVGEPETVEQLLAFCQLQNPQYGYQLQFDSVATSQLQQVYQHNADLMQRLYQVLKSVKANPDEPRSRS